MADHQAILKELAPCGLDCFRCASYSQGEIKKLSTELLDALGNFEKVAARLAGFVPALKNYPEFKEVLVFLTRGSCSGCRAGGGQFPLCSARNCFKEKGVDFCFQCDEYPCARNKYDPELTARWRKMNDRMKEAGVEKFYEEQKGQPRY
ncbi:MAG: DUF3795 domain-containing protein [Peptococcaceae bacterium]|nr:MAG: DUF3795 domain-containing protein [Peptococcaceae bacterium]